MRPLELLRAGAHIWPNVGPVSPELLHQRRILSVDGGNSAAPLFRIVDHRFCVTARPPTVRAQSHINQRINLSLDKKKLCGNVRDGCRRFGKSKLLGLVLLGDTNDSLQ